MFDNNYKDMMKEIFYRQNIYLHTTARRTIYGITNPTKSYATKTNENMSFKEWVATISYGDEQFLDACELGPAGNMHLIFNNRHASTVQKLFGTGLKQVAQQHFHPKDIEEIFSSSHYSDYTPQ